MAGSSSQVRIGLTISGAIALGAYEGGALAALLAAVQAVNAKQRDDEQDPLALRVDVMAGASAGSITALLATRTLLGGLDPIEVMYRAWVRTPQLQQLRDANQSPLSVDRTREDAAALLSSPAHAQREQLAPVKVHMALGCLHGLAYDIGRIGGPPVRAITYLDWAEWDISSAEAVDWYTKSGALDAALASGAHAAAFPPYGLDRSDPKLKERYEANGIVDFPPSNFLWYTDGGTLDNEPLGRALDMAQEVDLDDPIGDAKRLHLMITPDPARPPRGDDRWTLPERPAWSRTGLRTLKLLRSQRLYDDLRRVEKTNSRVEWGGLLEDRLVSIMSGESTDAEASLNAVTEQINAQRERLKEPDDLRTPRPSTPDTDLGIALRQAFRAATGLSGKSDIAVAVVSPMVLPEVADGSTTPRDLLAGDFLGHFGGFLAQRLRESDFALGYRCMLQWLEGEELSRCGLSDDLRAVALDGATEAREQWRTSAGRAWVTGLGAASLSTLPRREKRQLYKVALRSAWIVFNQIRRGEA